MKPTILCIGGSDCSAGAGIQADIKTASALNCYAATVLTAITAQNSNEVSAIEALQPSLVVQQISAVTKELNPLAVKIGMLGSIEVAHVVSEYLLSCRVPVVLDPVLRATSGKQFVDPVLLDFYRARLVAQATVLTPNIDELFALVGQTHAQKGRDFRELGVKLVDRGCPNVLVKGGHLKGAESADYLVSQGSSDTFSLPRIMTSHTHGSGCTLATAIGVGLAQGMSVFRSVQRAKIFVHKSIETAAHWKLTASNGPLIQYGHEGANSESDNSSLGKD